MFWWGDLEFVLSYKYVFSVLLLPITRIVTSPIGVGMNAKSAKLKEIFSEKLRFNTSGMDEDNWFDCTSEKSSNTDLANIF